MVSIVNRGLKQFATHWAVSPNGTGGDLFAQPVLLRCRWENRQETFVGQLDRKEQVSKSVVLTDRPVAVGDYLAYGDLLTVLDPTLESTADKVKRFQTFPDLRNLEAQHKSLL